MKIKNMANEITAADRNDAVHRYASGVSAYQIARELGVKSDTVARWAKQVGLKVRSRTESQRISAKRVDIDVSAVVAAFDAGASVNGIAKQFGTNRQVVMRCLREGDRKARGRSEAETLKWRRLREDSGITTNQLLPAWKARRGQRGSTTPTETQARSGPLGRYEIELMLTLRDSTGLPYRLHAAAPCGERTYKIDIALEERRVAIEVAYSWSKGRTGSIRPQRLKHLLDSGWSVLVLYVPPRKTPVDVSLLAKHVVTFTERASRNHSPRGQYGVIDRYGEPMPAHYLQLYDRSRVEGF